MFKMIVTLWVGLFLQAAQAQTPLPDRSGEAALACLARPEGGLSYPPEMLKQRVGGFYRVQLRFTDPGKKPEVEVLFEAGSDRLREAVLDYTDRMRLPCLSAGQTVVAVQEFSFDALGVGRVKSPAPLNLPSPPSESYSRCLRTPAEPPELRGSEAFSRIRQALKNGNLIAELHFNAPDQAPQVDLLYDSLTTQDRNEILHYLSQYRVPCLPVGGKSGMQQHFTVRWSGNNAFAFNDLSIVKFLGLVKDLNAKPVEFNLDSMACPFQIRWGLGRPAVRNEAHEVGIPSANRLPLLKWLEEVELNLTKEQFEGLLGAELLIDVPCGTIRLGDAAG